jgi:hypothetical protein
MCLVSQTLRNIVRLSNQVFEHSLALVALRGRLDTHATALSVGNLVANVVVEESLSWRLALDANQGGPRTRR